MRFFIYFGLIILLLACFWVEAKSGTKLIIPLDQLDTLVMISQNVDPELTNVLIDTHKKNDNEQCFCFCAEYGWSCTSVECSYHEKKCSNQDLVQQFSSSQ